jgi:hypothetical protein
MHMLVFNNYFCKNRKSKLHFGDRVAVLNVFLYQTRESTFLPPSNERSNTFATFADVPSHNTVPRGLAMGNDLNASVFVHSFPLSCP